MTAHPENALSSAQPETPLRADLPGTPGIVAPRSIGQWLSRISVNDWIVLAYLGALDLAILASPHHGAARDRAIIEMSSLLLGFIGIVVVLVRGGILDHPIWTPLAFRVAHYGGIQCTYFFMRGFLPVVNPGSLDAELHELGVGLFGVEPALAMQSWISPATTEWFAFFYYGYFFVLGVHVIPILFAGRNPVLLCEFSLGLLLVLCVGQSLYLLVPGYGPASGLPGLFHVSLPEGIWWNLVRKIVESAGAQKDIFPSIHTAAPSFILLFSFQNRRYLPYRYSWPLVAFFVFNIIVATMFLRWHWLVDIVAGLTLAWFAHVGSVHISRWERRYRNERGLPPSWPEWPRRQRRGLGNPA